MQDDGYTEQQSTEGAVVITGASSGIGKACALYLDELGYTVFAGVRKVADGEALQQSSSPRLVPLLLDITHADSVANAVHAVKDVLGGTGVAALINNAGIVVDGPLEFLPVEQLRVQFEVNLVGHVAVTQAFLPLLRTGSGRIIQMSSIMGLLALPFLGPYCASKFALEGLSDSLRMELRASGIPVILIEPGSISTPVWEKSIATAEELAQKFSPQAMELYGEALAAHQASLKQSDTAGIPPDAVAQTVATALAAPSPKARYLVGRDAKIMSLFAKLAHGPRRDRVITRRMKLPQQAATTAPAPNSSPTARTATTAADKGAVFITGASSGIGATAALKLDAMGYRVFAGALHEHEGAHLLEKASERLSVVELDITDAAAVTAAAARITDAVGEAGLVGLVNNAGTVTMAPFEFLPPPSLRQELEVNVLGHIAVTQAFLPLIRQSGGRLVYTGSAAGRLALPYMSAYSASKFAVEALVDALRVELRPWGISVSLLQPGRIKTSLWQRSIDGLTRFMESLPQHAHELYGPAVDAVSKVAHSEYQTGISPDVAAAAIVHALTAKRPKTRYPVGRDARVQVTVARFVPERMRDRTILRRMGLA